MLFQQRHICIAIAGFSLSGCVSFGPHSTQVDNALQLKLVNGETSTDSAAIRASVRRELNIGNTDTANTPIRPAEYTAAGYAYVDRHCNAYFDALIDWQNRIHYSSDLLSAGSAAVQSIAGLAKASSGAIAGVAAGTGFGVAGLASFDNRALLTPYPNETKTLISNYLITFRERTPSNSIATPEDAITAVQRYAEICTLSGITRAAKQALTTFKGAVDVPPSNSGTIVVINEVVTAELGLKQQITSEQLVALYLYLNSAPPAWKDKVLGPKLLEVLKPLANSLEKDGVAIDPAPVEARVGSSLKLAFSDSSFKADVANLKAKLSGDATSSTTDKPTKKSKGDDALTLNYGTGQTSGARDKAKAATSTGQSKKQMAIRKHVAIKSVAESADVSTPDASPAKLIIVPLPASSGVGHFDLSKQKDTSPPPPPPPAPD